MALNKQSPSLPSSYKVYNKVLPEQTIMFSPFLQNHSEGISLKDDQIFNRAIEQRMQTKSLFFIFSVNLDNIFVSYTVPLEEKLHMV